MSDLWGREPAAIVAAVEAIIILAVAFGLDISTEQMGAILAALTVILGLVTRSQVSPAGSGDSSN